MIWLIFEPNKSYIRLMNYNWELPDWPKFAYSTKEIASKLYNFAQETGEVNVLLKSLPADLRQETLLETILSEAIKTSAIEGEFLSREDVMSSIKNNLGINKVAEVIKDKRALGIVSLNHSIKSFISFCTL